MDGPRRFTLALFPVLVLALGLGTTYGLWHTARGEAAKSQEDEFRFWVSKVASEITDHYDAHVGVLRGVVGLFNASDEVTRKEFRDYVWAQGLGTQFPGVEGVGFVAFVPADRKAEHLASVRRDGFPEYAVRPEGERPFYAPVVYIEPFTGPNLLAFGYDIALEPARWQAAERARDLGGPSLSGKVRLQQERLADTDPGFLVFMPVFRRQSISDTVDARRANLLGWAYLPVHMSDLMKEVLDGVGIDALQSPFRVEVYDGDRQTPDARLFDFGPGAGGTGPDPALRAVRLLDLGGHPWSVVVSSGPEFEAGRRMEKATLIAIGGAAGSLLLALFALGQTASHVRLAAALGEADRVNRQLVDRERELLLAQRTAQLGNWSFDPVTRRAIWSEGVYRIFGLEPGASAPGYDQHRRLIHPEDRPRFDQALKAAARGRPYRIEFRIQRPDGDERTIVSICTPQRNEAGEVVRVSGTIQDVTERVRLQEALREQAIRDPLTGLFNRRYLDETLPRELANCQRTGEPLAVAMLDLDHFKFLNDVHGHEAGDQVLRAVGERLRCFLRTGDLACRYGGEELTLILPGADLTDARDRLDELRLTLMQTPVRYRGGDLPVVTVSIGLAAAQPADTDAGALLSRADAALYLAKAQGRNRVVAASG
jgi:diguanylate cyclase (GGDEF)-like protein/PAS domain S-box-containing protein